MIEYVIIAIGDISFSTSGQYSVLLPYFIFGGIVMVVIGYWIKKTLGAFIALLSALFAYLYLTGFFDRTIWSYYYNKDVYINSSERRPMSAVMWNDLNKLAKSAIQAIKGPS